MQPIRFLLHLTPERGVGTDKIVNYWVYTETPDIARLDEPPERNFETIDAVMRAIAKAQLPEETLNRIRAALETDQSISCELTERQAEAIGLGFLDS